jgi:hypothetical protein
MRKLSLLLIWFVIMYISYDLWSQAIIIVMNAILDSIGFVLEAGNPEITGFLEVLLGCVVMFFMVRKFIRWLLSFRRKRSLN